MLFALEGDLCESPRPMGALVGSGNGDEAACVGVAPGLFFPEGVAIATRRKREIRRDKHLLVCRIKKTYDGLGLTRQRPTKI